MELLIPKTQQIWKYGFQKRSKHEIYRFILERRACTDGYPIGK
jgi:hypothetical protein